MDVNMNCLSTIHSHSTSSVQPPLSPSDSTYDLTLPATPTTCSASIIELQVAPLSGIDNDGFEAGAEEVDNVGEAEDLDNNAPGMLRRDAPTRLSKKSLEIPYDDENGNPGSAFEKSIANFTVGNSQYDNQAFQADDAPEDVKLRNAFEKSVESVKVKRGNFISRNKVNVTPEDAGAGVEVGAPQDKGTNTEVVIHPHSELQKSYSLGCLMYQLNSGGTDTSESRPQVPSSLVRSESLDTCLQPEPGVLCRWTPFSNLDSSTGAVAPISWRKTSETEATNGGETRGDTTVVDMNVTPDIVVDPMPKRKRPVRAQSTLSSCSSMRSDARVCRICWFSEEREPCIQPCYCSGSTACVHAACLHKWLSVTNTFRCEICLYKFMTTTKMKPISKWNWKLEKSRERSQLGATLILLAIVTPPLICGIILCSQKIMEFLAAASPEQAWGSTGMPLALMTLVLASTLTYLVAIAYFLRKLGSVCRQWVRSNETTIVQLGDTQHVIEHGKAVSGSSSVWAIT